MRTMCLVVKWTADAVGLVQRFGAWRRSGFRSTKLSASTELDTKNKASFKHCTRFFAKRLLAGRCSIFACNCPTIF
jgi:hypothetical protein